MQFFKQVVCNKVSNATKFFFYYQSPPKQVFETYHSVELDRSRNQTVKAHRQWPKRLPHWKRARGWGWGCRGRWSPPAARDRKWWRTWDQCCCCLFSWKTRFCNFCLELNNFDFPNRGAKVTDVLLLPYIWVKEK